MSDHRSDLPQAPDWKPGVPSRFERQSAAWNVIYWGIPERVWVRASDVAREYAAEVGLLPSTIAGMIREAARYELLETRRVKNLGKTRWQYRRGMPSELPPDWKPTIPPRPEP